MQLFMCVLVFMVYFFLQVQQKEMVVIEVVGVVYWCVQWFEVVVQVQCLCLVYVGECFQVVVGEVVGVGGIQVVLYYCGVGVDVVCFWQKVYFVQFVYVWFVVLQWCYVCVVYYVVVQFYYEVVVVWLCVGCGYVVDFGIVDGKVGIVGVEVWYYGVDYVGDGCVVMGFDGVDGEGGVVFGYGVVGEVEVVLGE